MVCFSTPYFALPVPTHTRFQVDKEGAINIEDAAGFFANVFGGERFRDYVSALLPGVDGVPTSETDWRDIPHERYDICRCNDDGRSRYHYA